MPVPWEGAPSGGSSRRFADVAGSTRITEQHGAEEARLIIGEAISRAVRVVEAYGGTVKDLAGDGMLAIFGAPVAHEDDPERAVLAPGLCGHRHFEQLR